MVKENFKGEKRMKWNMAESILKRLKEVKRGDVIIIDENMEEVK